VIEPFRFAVRNAFTRDDRGTVALGYIESGTVRVRDELVLLHHNDRRTVRCAGITDGVRIADWEPGDPAPIRLMLPELETRDLAPGDVLESADRSWVPSFSMGGQHPSVRSNGPTLRGGRPRSTRTTGMISIQAVCAEVGRSARPARGCWRSGSTSWGNPGRSIGWPQPAAGDESRQSRSAGPA
jgi:hypothetical protein